MFWEWLWRRITGRPDPYLSKAWERGQEMRRKLEQDKKEWEDDIRNLRNGNSNGHSDRDTDR